MTPRYDVRMLRPSGGVVAHLPQIAALDGAALSYVLRGDSVPGALTVTYPRGALSPEALTALRTPDTRIQIWREAAPGVRKLDGDATWLVQRARLTRAGITVTARHALSLLERRIIAYDAGTAYTTKGPAAAGNLIKAFARENLGASVNTTDRDGDDTGADLVTPGWLSIAADSGDGATLSVAATRRTLLNVAQSLARASIESGAYLAVDIVTTSNDGLELRTYAGQRGIDRRAQLILSEERGSLADAAIIEDWTEQATVAIVGGAGERTDRLIGVALATDRASPFWRTETFSDDAQSATQAAVDAEAAGQLRAAQRRRYLEGTLAITPSALRGIHYDVGDRVTVSFDGESFDVLLESIEVTVASDGMAERARFRSI